ncbi:Flp family type IVb pilin [Methylobacillus sp. Pita1]|uniref:Flp family type IVb pilin n=1 Tax=Methylobacillus sp. Pita1 TaxID=3382642 RepID=UPI0038B43E82
MFATMKQWLVNLYLDEEGASGIEYALIAAMVAVVIAGLSDGVRASVQTIFESIRDALAAAGT